MYLDIGNNATSGEAAQLGSGNFAGNIDMQGNNQMRFMSTLNNTLSGTISGGTGTIITLLAGTGTTTLAAANTYSGRFLVSANANQSILNLGHANALQSARLELSGTNALRFSPSIGTFNVGRMSGAGNFALTATDNSAVTLSIGGASAGASDTISGTISGLGGLTKVGSGTLTLSASNSYAGTTTFSDGVLSLNNANALAGGGNLTFSGGTLQYTANNTADYASRIVSSGSAISIDTNSQNVTWTGGLAASNSGGLTKLGSGTLTLAANNSYTGLTTTSAGSLQIGNGGTTGSVGGSIANNAALVFNRSNDLVQSGSIFGTGSVTKLGSGTLTLAANNSYTGLTTISAGSLQIGNGGTTGSVGGNIANNAALVFNRSNDLVQSGSIFGTGSVTKQGAGTLSLTGGLGFSGGLSVSAGTVAISNNASGTSVGTLTVGAASALPRVSVSSGTFSFGSASVSALGSAAGARGAMTISEGSVSQAGGGRFDIGSSGAGVVGQTGGSASYTNFITGLNGNGYGAYLISGGTATLGGSGFAVIGNSGNGLFQQTGGSVSVTTSEARGFNIGSGGGAYGVVDIQSGTLTANPTNGFMRVGGGAATSGNMTGVLTIRDTGYVQVQSTFQVVATTGVATPAPTGIVNLIGGTLETREITKVANATSRATLNADGGTLKVFSTNSGTNFLQGLDNAFIYSKGLTVDTNGQSVTIAQALTAPAGFGVLASGSTLAVASGGSGYIAPPLVTFAAPSGGGVRATGLATIDANGTVTGITITSPGSGYTSGEAVAVSFNQGSNASGAALTVATGFNATASQATASGGLTKTGAGTLTLSGSNTYTGATTVSAGILALGTADRLSNSTAVTVNGGGLDMASFNDTVASLAITSGSVFGAGTLTAATYGLGGGTVAANLGGGTLNVTGNSTLSGAAAATAVNLNAGTLTLVGAGRLTGNAAVSGSAGAALALGGNETVASLAGIANVNLGSSRLTVGDATNTTYSGVLSGAGGGLTKTGAGRLLLDGANLYSGATTIAEGTLALDAGGSFANSSSIIVGNAGSSGAVLDLTAKTGSFDIGAGQTLGGGGTVQLASSGTLNVLGLLSPGNSPGLLTFDAGTTLLSGTTLMEVWGTSRATAPSHGTGYYDAINVIDSGVLTFGGLLQLSFDQTFSENSTFSLFTPSGGGSLAGNFTGVSVIGSFYNTLTWSQSEGKWTSSQTENGESFEFDSGTGNLTFVVVPEPGALALAGIGIAAAAWVRRRRRS